MAISIEMLLDVAALSIEEVMGWLKVVDDRDEPSFGGEVTIGGELHFTKERWLTH